MYIIHACVHACAKMAIHASYVHEPYNLCVCYMCMYMYHFGLSLQQLCYSFDIFHMRESLIPVDTIEVKGQSRIITLVV